MNKLSDERRELFQTWRRALHTIPETGFTEEATSDYVSSILAELGIEHVRNVGGTGIVATISRGTGGDSIGIRADMDALPILEETGVSWASQNTGFMHACGHDGHMTMALGAAAVLAQDAGFNGTVHFVFQPAEEHGLGAKAMLGDGLLDRFPMSAMFGLHNSPGIPAGHFHTRSGGLMASEDNFEIRIHGRGGHASGPHMVVDPILVGSEVVIALQTIVARSLPPTLPAVVSCTEFTTDGARNAIPSNVTIKGDTRSFDSVAQDLLERRMRELVSGICAAHGATGEVFYTHEFEPTINDAHATAMAVAAARVVAGDDRVEGDCPPWMASEDFGTFGRAVPGCFVFIGNGATGEHGGVPLHSHDYQFNDAILDNGVNFYVELVRAALPTETAQ
jgi:hippurate hydrolase